MTLLPVPLTYDHIRHLAPRIREADLADLTIHDTDPEQALVSGMTLGESFAVLDDGVPIGAGGWTVAGAVWTLWTDLTRKQSLELLRCCVPWARIMAIRAKRPLTNVFLSGNTVTERWLRATRCVTILDNQLLSWKGRSYVPFYLKPLEELPYV